jgi:hypothetical protein
MKQPLQLATRLRRELFNRPLDLGNLAHGTKLSVMHYGINSAAWRGLQDQMKMITHQATGMHLPLRLSTGFAQRGQESPAVRVILENIVPAVPPIHAVINRSGILGAQCGGTGIAYQLPQGCQ